MTLPTTVPLVARKTITTIQQDSVYKERWVLKTALPTGSTVRQEFFDSSGASIVEIVGVVNGAYLEFEVPYATVALVPNGAGFYVYVQLPDDVPPDEHMVRYGTVFRRQLFFPDSPATIISTVPRKYEDTFQRPAGAVGGRWTVLVGRPRIYDNNLIFVDCPNTVGPDFTFFSRYFMRYYVPFTGDTIIASFQLIKKPALLGQALMAVSCSSDGSSYIYARFDGGSNEVDLGIGTGPDIGTEAANLDPQVEPVSLTVPDDEMGTYKLRYDDTTGKLALYNDDFTTEYVSWTDTANLAPHGAGYRYFALAGQTGVVFQGIQFAYVSAQDTV